MTPLEFDIIDELYFVTSFAQLVKSLPFPEAEIEAGIMNLLQQGFLKCFYPDPETEISQGASRFPGEIKKYYFLATKAGLLAHNSR